MYCMNKKYLSILPCYNTQIHDIEFIVATLHRLFLTIFAFPHRGGWISRGFGKIEPWISSLFFFFFKQKCLFSSRFPEKIHTGTKNSDFSNENILSVWIFQEKKKSGWIFFFLGGGENSHWNSRFCVHSIFWGRAQFVWNSPLLTRFAHSLSFLHGANLTSVSPV